MKRRQPFSLLSMESLVLSHEIACFKEQVKKEQSKETDFHKHINEKFI